MQETAWAVTTIFIVVLAAIFVWVISHSREHSDYTPIQRSGYLWRKRLFFTLVGAGVPLMGATLMNLPYAASESVGSDAMHVEAMGYQWYWEISATEAKVGQPVVFHVKSADVHHGFGLYDASMRLVAQTQAIPGYTNELVHVFNNPGTYQILCLEFCGVAHHQMKAEFRVVAAQKGEGM